MMTNTFEPSAPEDEQETIVELHIEGHQLRDLDGPFKSDPFAVLYTRDEPTDPWNELGRTETLRNCRDPKFVRAFELHYTFELLTELRVELFDRDANSEKLERHDYMGCICTTLAQVITSPGCSLTLELQSDLSQRKRYGFVTLYAEEVARGQMTVYFDLGMKLDKKDPKLYQYIIHRSRDKSSWTPVFKSQATRAFNGVLRFPSCIMKGSALNGGDESRVLRIELQREKSRNKYEALGFSDTSLKLLMTLPSQAELDIVQLQKGSEKSGGKRSLCLPTGARQSTKVASLIVYQLQIVKQPTFLDYLAGGCKLNVNIALDFGSSKATPSPDGALPHPDAEEYETVIRVIADVVEKYTSDTRYKAYGFGARLPPMWHPSHCFLLNPTAQDVNGVQGILTAYRRTLQTVQRLYGPTIFSEIIRAVASNARGQVSQQRQTYSILFILTDGMIADIEQTMEQVVRSSHLPMSIVIIGIGNEDYTKMRALDGDERKIHVNGKQAARDTVQFVPFKEYHHDRKMLAKELLAEIPQQVVDFFNINHIKPNAPVSAHPVLRGEHGSLDRREERGSLDRREERGSVDRREERGSLGRREERGSLDRREESGSLDRREERGSLDRREESGSLDRREERGSLDRREERLSLGRRNERGSFDRRGEHGSLDRRGERGSIDRKPAAFVR